MSATITYIPEHLICGIRRLSTDGIRTSRIMSEHDVFLNFYQAATETIGSNLICLVKWANAIIPQSPATRYKILVAKKLEVWHGAT